MAPRIPGVDDTLRHHWPEYLIEGWALGMFMISAGAVSVLLESPGSALHRAIVDGDLRRFIALEYIAPRTGRPTPPDTAANDRWHWQINIITDSVESAASATLEAGFDWVSSGPVALEDSALGFTQGLMLRDPDGHATNLVSP